MFLRIASSEILLWEIIGDSCRILRVGGSRTHSESSPADSKSSVPAMNVSSKRRKQWLHGQAVQRPVKGGERYVEEPRASGVPYLS